MRLLDFSVVSRQLLKSTSWVPLEMRQDGERRQSPKEKSGMPFKQRKCYSSWPRHLSPVSNIVLDTHWVAHTCCWPIPSSPIPGMPTQFFPFFVPKFVVKHFLSLPLLWFKYYSCLLEITITLFRKKLYLIIISPLSHNWIIAHLVA